MEEKIMTRREKIIVSCIGIFLVLITLLGITYAYFLTRVEGNTNEKSVIISTANLLLEYSDGDGNILIGNSISPGDLLESKSFSVENKGTDTIDSYAVYLENIINEFKRNEDLKIKIDCKVFDVQKNMISDKTCNGVNELSYPKMNSMLVSNVIAPNERHDYTLTLTYKNETTIDQSIDMNKTIQGKIQIYDLNDIFDISGTVIGATDGDYVVIGDEKQTSEIIDSKYKLVGFSPNTYTMYIKNKSKNAEGEEIVIIKGSKTFTIDFANEEKLDGDTLYITKDSTNITLNLTKDTEIQLDLIK